MKKITFLFLLLSVLSIGLFAKGQKGLARVQKLDGIEVYILSEPLREYEVVTSVDKGIQAESILTGGLFNSSITDKVLQFIRKARKQGATFDAVLYSGGKSLITIKFTGNDKTNKGLCRVRTIENAETYILCEPLEEYETIITKDGGAKWKSILTGGVINNSIEEDITLLIKKMRGEGVTMDGVIYSGGKSATSIKFAKK